MTTTTRFAEEIVDNKQIFRRYGEATVPESGGFVEYAVVTLYSL